MRIATAEGERAALKLRLRVQEQVYALEPIVAYGLCSFNVERVVNCLSRLLWCPPQNAEGKSISQWNAKGTTYEEKGMFFFCLPVKSVAAAVRGFRQR